MVCITCTSAPASSHVLHIFADPLYATCEVPGFAKTAALVCKRGRVDGGGIEVVKIRQKVPKRATEERD